MSLATAMKANYFSHLDYVDLDAGKGVITSRSGTRLVAFPFEFTLGLLESLEDECGQAWPVVLYKCGEWWGRRQMQRYEKELSAYYGSALEELPTAHVHASLVEAWGTQGWGKLSFELNNIKQGLIYAQVSDTPFAEVFAKSGRDAKGMPIDHLAAGALAGMFSHASNSAIAAHEISCVARGDANCTFVLGLSERLNEVPNWVKKGTSKDDIQAQLKQ